MRWAALMLVLLLGTVPRLAEAGAGCLDACTADPTTGRTCLDEGFGCNPATFRCEPCVNDAWCSPGGTCHNGACVNMDCSADGGVIDSGLAPVEGGVDAGQDPADAMPMDAAPLDALPVDALPVDALPIDALPIGGRGGRGGVPEKGQYEEPCTCRHTGRPAAPPAGAALLAIGVLALAGRRPRAR